MAARAVDFVPDDAVAAVGLDHARDTGDAAERGTDIGPVCIELDVHRLGTAQPGREVVGRIDRHDPSLVDDDHTVAGLRHFGQDVRAQDDRVITPQTRDQLPCLDDLFGIQPCGRLIQNQHVRVVDERLRQADALPVTFRQPGTQPIPHVVDSRAFHDRLHPLATLGRRDPLDFGDEPEIFAHRHVGIERRCFREIAGAALCLEGLFGYIESGDDGPALGCRHVPGEDPHRGRLAGAVRTEKAENLAAFDAEAHVLHGRHGAVAFREILNLNHGELLSG